VAHHAARCRSIRVRRSVFRNAIAWTRRASARRAGASVARPITVSSGSGVRRTDLSSPLADPRRRTERPRHRGHLGEGCPAHGQAGPHAGHNRKRTPLRKAIATGIAQRGSVTQIPSIWSKWLKLFGSACDMIKATSALAMLVLTQLGQPAVTPVFCSLEFPKNGTAHLPAALSCLLRQQCRPILCRVS
jgi:hypothetical protein